MTHFTPPPPPFLKAFAAILLSTALSLPASAQQIQQTAITHSRVLQSTTTYVTRLNQNLVWPAPTVQGRTWTGLVRNLKIEVLPGPAGSTTTFGVGGDFKCAHSPGPGQPVEFHNATGTYSRGGAIARACPTWTARKCSRSVTFMGRTFTANRGYPTCNEDTDENLPSDGQYTGKTRKQQTAVPDSIARTLSNGIFRVRVWGNVCINGGATCRSFKDGEGRNLIRNPTVVHLTGYGATFQHARHCGPERWPSEAWQQRSGPGYAEYCDITVDVR